MSVKIRLAVHSDAAKMCEINLKYLPENYPLGLWKLLLSTTSFSYVAEDCNSKEIVGYCLAVPLDEKKAIIASIAIIPEFRRRSIAKQLLLTSILSLKKSGLNHISLHVRISNPAQELYSKMGFKCIDTVHNYYSNPQESAFLMERN